MKNYSSTHRTIIDSNKDQVYRHSELSNEELNLYDIIKTYAYLMPRERSVDIDDLYQFEIAEFLAKNK